LRELNNMPIIINQFSGRTIVTNTRSITIREEDTGSLTLELQASKLAPGLYQVDRDGFLCWQDGSAVTPENGSKLRVNDSMGRIKYNIEF